MQQPASKAFDLADVRRIPVTQTDAARTVLNSTSEQGRLFPQALAEAFAFYSDVQTIALSLELEREHFPQHPSDNPEAGVLVVTVQATRRPPVRFFLLPSMLAQALPDGRGFHATACAYELVRLYPGETYGR